MRYVEQCTSCYEIVRRKGDTCNEEEAGRKKKERRCTYAKGEPASSLRSRPGREDGEGWVEDSTGVVGCGWNEEEESG